MASGTDVSCFGEEDGTISATASEGASITVDGMAYDASATYGPGSYLVCASAPGGNEGDVCTDCETIVIGEGDEVSLIVDATDVTCADATNGTIVASASEGAVITVNGEPYVAGALYAPATYLVCASLPGTVCQTCESVTIGAPDALMLVIDVECINGFGTATATVTGGTGEISYLWSTGVTTEMIAGLTNGEHWVIATDENGCWVKEGFSVDCEIICDLQIVVESGCLAANNGWAVVDQIIGATGSTEILWSTGETVQYITNLPTGDHWVMVTDANGCWDKEEFSIDCKKDCAFRTQTQGGWGAPPNGNNPGAFLHANFAGAFQSGLTIGCNNTLTLTSAQAVTNFLPAGGQPNMLPSGALVNPVNYNNTLAGQLVAATISVRFDAQYPDFGASETLLGDAYISSGTFMGWTVNALLAEANNYIGGCGSMYSKSQLNAALTAINENYVDGVADNGFLSCEFIAMASPRPSNVRVPSGGGNGRRIMMDENLQDVFEASPNPASQVLNVRLVHASNGDVSVDLMDLAGRTVQQIASYTAAAGEERRHVIGVEALPAGVYVLSVQQNGARNIQRIVVGH